MVDDFLADIVMVNRGEIDEHLRTEKQLKATIEELETKMAQTTLENRKKFDSEIKSLKNQRNKEIEELKAKVDSLKKNIKTLEMTHESQHKDSESKNVKAAEDLEALYERKVSM